MIQIEKFKSEYSIISYNHSINTGNNNYIVNFLLNSYNAVSVIIIISTSLITELPAVKRLETPIPVESFC